MEVAELLHDAVGRIGEVIHQTLEGITDEQLVARPEGVNSISWLIWHLTRIQDDHVAGVAGVPQRWTDGGWAERCGLPLDPADHGYGHSSAQVDSVRVSADNLAGYYDDVAAATLRYVDSLTPADLDRVVDDRWDPPVTLGVRLVSVLADDLQHAGQAAFLRGMLG